MTSSTGDMHISLLIEPGRREDILIEKRWNPDLGVEGCYARNRWLGNFLSCISHHTFEESKTSLLNDLIEGSDCIRTWIQTKRYMNTPSAYTIDQPPGIK